MWDLIRCSIIFVSYVTYCLFKFNLTRSISITYYKHDKKDSWLFIAFMFGFSLFMALAANGYMFWIAMFFAWITGIAADSRKSNLLRIAHVWGSVLMIASGAVGIGVHYGLWELPIVGAIGTGALIFPQVWKRTWLIEVWWYIIISFSIYHALQMNII